VLQAADRGYADGGPKGAMRAFADYAAEHLDRTSANTIAAYYARGDEPDQALLWLERAYSERVFTLPLDMAYPAFDPLRSDPRFQELLRKIGIPGA